MSEEQPRVPELSQDGTQAKRRRTEVRSQDADQPISGEARVELQMPVGAAVSVESSSGDFDLLWGQDGVPDDELLRVSDQMSLRPCLGGSDIAEGQNGDFGEGTRQVPDRVGDESCSDDPGFTEDRDGIPERRPRQAPDRVRVKSCSDDSDSADGQGGLPREGLRQGQERDDGEDPHPFSAIPLPGRRVVGPLYKEISSGLAAEADGFLERVRGVFSRYSHRRGPGGVSPLSGVLREWYDRHTNLCSRIDEAASISEVLVREISGPNEMVRVLIGSVAVTNIHIIK